MVLMWIPFLFGGNDHLEVATRYQIGSSSQFESQHCLFPFLSGVKCQLAPQVLILRVRTGEEKAGPLEDAFLYDFIRSEEERDVRDEGNSN